ncbi:hypothetical protein DFR57_12334, partial [Saliterribacillus persicus]
MCNNGQVSGRRDTVIKNIFSQKDGVTMDIDNDFEKNIERTKKRAKWGCLTWAIIL